MRRRTLTAAALAMTAGQAWGQPLTFDNSCGTGLWASSCGASTNWSPEVLPSLATDVTTDGTMVRLYGQNNSARSVVADTGLKIDTGATLTLLTDSQITNLHLGHNGYLITGAAVTIDGSSLGIGQAYFSGGGTLRNTGSFAGGLMIGNAQSASFGRNTGTWIVTDGATLDLIDSTFFNDAGTLRIVGDGSILGSNGLVQNRAAFDRTAAVSSEHASVWPRFEHISGTITIDRGMLWFRGGAEFGGGTATLAGDAVVSMLGGGALGSYRFGGLSSVSGQGSVDLSPNWYQPIRIDAPITFALTGVPGLKLNSYAVEHNATLTNEGRALWSYGSLTGTGTFLNSIGGNLTINAPNGGGLTARLENLGDVTQFTSVTIAAASGFTNRSSHALVTGDLNGPGPYRIEDGELRKPVNTATAISTLNAPIGMIGGTMTCDAATIRLRGGGNVYDGSRLTTGGAGRVDLDTGLYTVAGAGNVFENQVSLTKAMAYGPTVKVLDAQGLHLRGGETTPVRMHSGQLGGPGDILNEGRFDWLGGTVGVDGVAFLQNVGTMTIGASLYSPVLTGSLMNLSDASQWGPLSIQGGEVINSGTWIQSPGAHLSGSPALFQNSGTFRSGQFLSTAVTNVSVPFSNPGTVIVDGGELRFTSTVAQIENGALTGGTWIVQIGATLVLPGPLNRIAGAYVSGYAGGAAWLKGIDVVEGGTLEARGSIPLNGGLQLRSGGRIVVGPDATLSAPGGVTVGTIQGSVLEQFTTRTVLSLMPADPLVVAPFVDNHARVLPGDTGEPGPFRLDGEFRQHPTGVLGIELGGFAPGQEHDVLSATGAVTLDGTLDVDLIDSFVPEIGDAFTVVQGASITGQFASVHLPTLPAGRTWQVGYGETSVTLRVLSSCYPDCTGDSLLTVADFGCFQTRFVAADPYADCSGDGSLTVADFGCFQTKFVAGCP